MSLDLTDAIIILGIEIPLADALVIAILLWWFVYRPMKAWTRMKEEKKPWWKAILKPSPSEHSQERDR